MAVAEKGKPKAFVIMPFDDEFASVYEDLISPALESAGYDVARADTRLDQQNVMRDVVVGIATADLIVADVTGRNPNVMYELGIAHGLTRPTITITQASSDLPFDLSAYRVVKYSEHYQEAKRLRETLEKVGKAHLKGEVKWGSPVTDFAQTDQPSTEDREPLEPSSETPSDDSEKGFLDYIERAEGSGQIITNTLGVIGAATAEVGAKLNAHAERLNALTESEPGPGAVRQYQRIAFAAAGALEEFSGQMEDVLPELETETSKLVEGGLGYARWLRDAGEDEATATTAEEFQKTVRELREATELSRDQILDLRESVQGLRGVSQPLTRASSGVTKNLDRIVAVQDELIAFSNKTLALLGDDESTTPEGDQPITETA